MAVTVQTKVTDYQDLVPFFYLRITGLPFYIFATINPSDSRYGSFAWSTPTGFPATWAQRGLQLPDDQIEQKLTDIIGCVASPGRCRLSVIDFADPTHPGFGYFSRLFAAGRTLSNSSIPNAFLLSPISAVPGMDTTINVYGANASFTNNADVYIGAETVGTGMNTDLGSGEWELAIADRNKYVCYGNSGDGGTYWPPVPYHRTGIAAGGAVQQSSTPIVAGDVMDMLGRTAALWMGHMRPDGNPEPESNSACLLLGRISSLEIGKVGGAFDITINSIVGDLSSSLVAPDLATATIQPGIHLEDSSWCSFYLQTSEAIKLITIATGIYTPAQIVSLVNAQIASNFSNPYVTLQLVTTDSGTAFQFIASAAGGFSIGTVPNNTFSPSLASLLYAMGFDIDTVFLTAPDQGTSTALLAPRAAASVFIPTGTPGTRNAVSLVEPSVSSYFFASQNTGTGKGWGVLGNGNIVQVVSVGGAGNSITTGQSYGPAAAITGADGSDPRLNRFYYVEPGTSATIAQVVVLDSLETNFTHFLGTLLASTTGVTSDGDLNIYPEGVGLGWSKLLTANDWAQSDETGIPRIAYITASTSFMDLFGPYSREHGLFIVWDPSAGGIRLRRFQIPTAAGASLSGATNVSFTESNRAKADDRTSQRADRSSLRTSWKLQASFSGVLTLPSWRGGAPQTTINGNKPSAIVLVDARARSMYPNDARQESIEDHTLVATANLGDMIARLVRLYGAPWTLAQRSMNKRGMLLAPGTIHQVVDNTMINPFTGAQGITALDLVYCFLTRVAVHPSTGEVTIEFVINSSDDQSLYRQWSPSALVDFNLNTGGYTNGYNSGTKSLSTVQHYGSNVSGDGAYFAIGDTIRVIQRDNSQTPLTEKTDTVAGVSGGVITLTTGISALATDSESVVILQKYNSAATTRKTGATRVSWQGDGATRTIQGNASVRLNRWA